MTEKSENIADLEADLDLAREIAAPNLEMRMRKSARDPARPRKSDLDPVLDLAPAPDKENHLAQASSDITLP